MVCENIQERFEVQLKYIAPPHGGAQQPLQIWLRKHLGAQTVPGKYGTGTPAVHLCHEGLMAAKARAPAL
jgi:hypothetical protein